MNEDQQKKFSAIIFQTLESENYLYSYLLFFCPLQFLRRSLPGLYENSFFRGKKNNNYFCTWNENRMFSFNNHVKFVKRWIKYHSGLVNLLIQGCRGKKKKVRTRQAVGSVPYQEEPSIRQMGNSFPHSVTLLLSSPEA